MGNISKFGDWMPFNNKNDDKSSNDIIIKYHSEWVKKYPELGALKLESDYYKGKYNWLYSLNKEKNSINIDLFLEIEKNDDDWSINLELVLESEDDYLVNNVKNLSLTQDEKHFEKNNLNWEKLNYHLKRVCEWVRTWNEDFHKEWGVYPLID